MIPRFLTETPLPLIDVTWVDSGLLIHFFQSAIGKITSYGNLARTLLAYVCGSGSNEIHLLFDTYHPMSLNVNERKLRGADDRPFLITGPEQALIHGCQRLLQNEIFNDQLVMFLFKEWQEDQYGPILANNTLIVSHGGNCLQLTFNKPDWKIHVGHPAHLQSRHEKADILFAFHTSTFLEMQWLEPPILSYSPMNYRKTPDKSETYSIQSHYYGLWIGE